MKILIIILEAVPRSETASLMSRKREGSLRMCVCVNSYVLSYFFFYTKLGYYKKNIEFED